MSILQRIKAWFAQPGTDSCGPAGNTASIWRIYKNYPSGFDTETVLQSATMRDAFSMPGVPKLGDKAPGLHRVVGLSSGFSSAGIGIVDVKYKKFDYRADIKRRWAFVPRASRHSA